MAPPTLCFGIELEAVLLFHQSLLANQLSSNPAKSHFQVIKDTGLSLKRKSTQQTKYFDKKYQGWTLLDESRSGVPDRSVALIRTGTSTSDQTLEKHMAYLEEPLEIAKEVLRSVMDIHVHSDFAKLQDFTRWSLVRDASIDSLSRCDLEAALKQTSAAADDWDSYGIELVSPPYSDTEMAVQDVTKILDTLANPSLDSHHRAIVNDQTGFHVHVGLAGGAPFPLRVLQYLSLFLVTFEHELDLLHPVLRRSVASNTEILTNKENFFAEGASAVQRSVWDPVTKAMEDRKQLPLFESLSQIRERLFVQVDRKEKPREALLDLVGRIKEHLVNFSYSNRDPSREGPATVEFRQHEGCLQAAEVGHWIQHCLGLVRLAWRYADEESMDQGKGGRLSGLESWDDERLVIETLWEEMDLPESTAAWYAAKVARSREEAAEGDLAVLWEDDFDFGDEGCGAW